MDDGWVVRVKVVNPFCNVNDDGEAVVPLKKLGAVAAEERVVEVAVVHEVVNEEETTAFRVGREAYGGDHVGRRTEPRSEEEFVVELAFPLEGGGVHELDSDGFGGWREGAGEDGAEAALAEAGGEGAGGAAEDGVGELVRGVGGWGGAFSSSRAVAEAEENEEDERAC